MHQNLFKQQLVSTLNPDSVYQTHFLPQSGQNLGKQIERHSVTGRQSINSQEKRQYLSVVSKGRKPQKKSLLKGNKKNTQKKIHSVILGGEHKTNVSITNSEKSLKSSLCRSCINLHQRNQITTEPSSTYNYNTVQPNPIFMRPQSPVPIQNSNSQQLNRIISHKLNLANIQPHQMVMKIEKSNRIPSQNTQARFGGKMIRNMSSAGRIYFSVGNSVDRKQDKLQENEKALLTPKFDQKNEQKQKKRRKNVGFIRSASAPKVSHQSNPQSPSKQPISSFQPNCSQSSKQLQINQCIQKMSLIRKQIDQLQQFLHDRLQSTLKSKFMYNPSTSSLKNSQIPDKEISFSTVNHNSRASGKESIYTPVNSLKIFKTQENEPKPALMQVKSSALNASLASSKLTNFYSQNQQSSQPLPNFQEFYQLKCPTSNYNVNMEKQIISQIASRHVKVNKENQQNVFYHKNTINTFR